MAARTASINKNVEIKLLSTYLWVMTIARWGLKAKVKGQSQCKIPMRCGRFRPTCSQKLTKWPA